MSYIVHQRSAKFSRSIIGKFIPDLSLVVTTTNSISIYTLDLVLLKSKTLLDEVLQIEKYHHEGRDGVAIMFKENRMSFVYYDYTINDFNVYALKYFSRYPSANPFFRLQGEIGFAKLNDIHFAIFCVHTKTQSAIFSFRDVKKDLRNVTDACFLDRYMLPTICFLYRPHICKYTREEDARVLVVSFDLHTRASFVQNFLSFYKNEYVFTLTNCERYVKHEDSAQTARHSGVDAHSTCFPCEEQGTAYGGAGKTPENDTDGTAAEQLQVRKNAPSQGQSTVDTSDMIRRCSQYIDVDFAASEFIGQSRSLLIFTLSKTLLITPKEDSHKVYDLDVCEIEFSTGLHGSCAKGVGSMQPGSATTSVFENVVFTGGRLFTLDEHIASDNPVSQACMRLTKNVTEVKTLEEIDIVCSVKERESVPAGYCKVHVANNKVCLSNDTASMIQGVVIDSATIGFHYLDGLYYHVKSSSVDVMDESLVNINTFEFTSQIHRSHVHQETMILLEETRLVFRDKNMKIVREILDVQSFAANEQLVVTRGTVVDIMSLEDMVLMYQFHLDDFGPAAVDKRHAADTPDTAEKKSTPDAYTGRIVEIESIGNRDNFCLAMRSDEDDLFVYRIFRDALIKISHNRIPEFGPGRAFFRIGRFLYIKAKTPLIVCYTPFLVQECMHAFEYISEDLGVQDERLLEIKLETQLSGTRSLGNARLYTQKGIQKEVPGNLCSGANAESSGKDMETGASEREAKRCHTLAAHKNGIKNHIVVATRPAVFTKEKVETQAENSEEEDDVEHIGAETLQFLLELYSSDFLFIHEYELQKDEYVNAMKMLVLNDIHSQSGKGEFLVVCTSYVKSEDWQFKGRLLLFELIEVNPDPMKPWTNRKLKILCIENCKGPVLDCCSLRGNIACCMGTKLMVYEVDRNEGINAIAFHDLQILATRIRAIKNYVCLGDIANGLMFFYFQAKPFKIHLLACSSKFCCDGLDFIVHKNILSMVAHGDGIYRIYTYTPANMFFDGTQLIKRCEFKSTDAVDVGFIDNDLVDRLYFRTLKSLKNTCGLTSPSSMAGDRLQPHTVRPPIYGTLLYEFLNLGLREQYTICADTTVERRHAVASLRCVFNK
ncbi:UNVERIFIED_CONTAM: hypothetical protein PYX00_011333 [Menopon gallinae]|uniref:RSE1/DDB1/CPSF1 C-terminal domain-containing protein n=1 Tax=Menopon gallinae TaxID=328185 RepID=A0AAW2H7C4_9NEOP